jgi:TPR repeat protein
MTLQSGAEIYQSPQRMEVIMKSVVFILGLTALLAGVTLAGTPCTPTTSTTPDHTADIETLQDRAEKGDSEAQYHLANMYRNGKGVERDDSIAAGWYQKAAEAGNVQAQYNLGMMRAIGKGLPKDEIRGYMWLMLAAVEGHDIAANKRDLVGKLLTPAQLSEAQQLAQDLEGLELGQTCVP